jgi:hypothetical protein
MPNAHAIAAKAEDEGDIIRPDKCETCLEDKVLIKHHRDYSKPLEITWLCQRCHRIEHCGNKELRDPNNKRHPVQFKQSLWELINKAALKDGAKKGEVITPSDYIRNIVSRHVDKASK